MMKKRSSSAFFAISGIILFLITWICAIYFSCYANEKEINKQVKLTIYNPFFIGVELEVKCDWDTKYNNNYKYYNIVTVPKRKNIELNVPNNMKRCEVWPLHLDW